MDEISAYQEALHFCVNNLPEVVARNMARDMVKMEELQQRISFLSNLCIRSKAEGWTEAQILEAMSA